MRNLLCTVCFFIFLLTPYTLDLTPVFAAPPNPLIYDTGPLPEGVKALREPRIPLPEGFKTLPQRIPIEPVTTGEQKIVVLLVEFQDILPTETPDYIRNLIFSQESGSKSMYTYYYETSYGQLKLVQGNAPLIWVQSARDKAYYGKDSDYLAGFIDDFNGPIYKLVEEAIASSDAQIDFSEYDDDGDGVVDHLVVVPAGKGQEKSGNTDDIWSHRWDIGGDEGGPPSILHPTSPEVIHNGEVMYETNDGVKINGYALTSELSPLGIFCHEFGHELGLPDLYVTAGRFFGDSGVGNWDLMDMGCWNPSNTGTSPSHPCAWCKKQLGWITHQEIQEIKESGSNLPVYPLENLPRHDVYKIPIEMTYDEYFLISYRKRQGYDSALPEEGLMIWHIDDSVGSVLQNNVNNNPEHRRVDLEKPGGKSKPEEIGSPFTEGDIFMEPDSNAYNEQPTKIAVFDIIGAGGAYITMNVDKAKFADTTEVSELINYPNPVKQETTITFTLTRPSPECSIDIYDLAGDLVKSEVNLSNEEINLVKIESVQREEYDKATYAYFWNGKNDDDDLVCPGIYLYLVKAKDTKTDKIIKRVGKLVILR